MTTFANEYDLLQSAYLPRQRELTEQVGKLSREKVAALVALLTKYKKANEIVRQMQAGATFSTQADDSEAGGHYQLGDVQIAWGESETLDEDIELAEQARLITFYSSESAVTHYRLTEAGKTFGLDW
jgi:hypothetical protein